MLVGYSDYFSKPYWLFLFNTQFCQYLLYFSNKCIFVYKIQRKWETCRKSHLFTALSYCMCYSSGSGKRVRIHKYTWIQYSYLNNYKIKWGGGHCCCTSVCNFLIAFDAFLYGLFTCATNLFPLPLILAYWPTMPLLICFLIEAVFLFARDMSGAMPFAIAVERLINVFFPLWLLKHYLLL